MLVPIQMQNVKLSTRGGARPNAGRKRAEDNAKDPQHTTRPALEARHPVHAMLSTRRDVPTLRQRCMYGAIHRVLRCYVEDPGFRIVHISIQRNHLHLIAEADNKEALRYGMQSFAIRAARAINKAWGRSGKVFEFRYQAKQIRTRDYARNALNYVLNNWRRHREDRGRSKAVLDQYSSAVSFDGWIGRPRWQLPVGYVPLPVSQPRTGLLQSGWTFSGLLDPWDTPGPPR